MDIEKEAWICLLRSSQENFQPKRLKNTTIVKASNVKMEIIVIVKALSTSIRVQLGLI